MAMTVIDKKSSVITNGLGDGDCKWRRERLRERENNSDKYAAGLLIASSKSVSK